jgi:CHASE2 domain-containing sensor protein/serine phosphatase RsbU (regulator of sigma subunit)
VTTAPPETPALRTARLRFTGAAIVAVFAAAVALDLSRMLPLQDAFFDTLQRASPRVVDATPVTIVQIDERSIAELGRWPWPRNVLARLIHAINAHGPAVIGVDIVMPEPDPLSPERALARVDADQALIDSIAELPSNDAELAMAFRVAPVVVVLVGVPESSSTAVRVSPVLQRDANGDVDSMQRAMKKIIQYPGALASLPVLNDAARGWGLINGDDSQGIVRRVPLMASVHGTLAPAFALEMWRVARRAPATRLATANGEVTGVGAADRTFATSGDGTVRPYLSRRNVDRAVSAYDVLTDSVESQRLRRTFVLIGVTALALGDSLYTPVNEKMPGVELHAQLIENMNDDTFLRRPGWTPYGEALALVLLGAWLIGSTPRWSVRSATLVALAGIAVLLGFAYVVFRTHRLLFDAATPSLGILLLFGTLLALTLASATRNRKALQEVVQRQREESARVAGELQAAQRIQLETLPRPESIDDPRIELAASMEPALEVGGDLYDFCLLDRHRLFFLLGDVSGKGLPASIFMAVSKALCKSTMLRGRDADLGELLMQANAEISRDNPAAYFVTAFVGVLNLESGLLEYCNAGQENPWLVHADDGRVVRLTEGGGPPLCVVDDFVYDKARTQLAASDLLCIVSDGVTEAVDRRGALYGTARVEHVIAPLRSADAMVATLRRDVLGFAAGLEPADDMTVLALRWRGSPDHRPV